MAEETITNPATESATQSVQGSSGSAFVDAVGKRLLSQADVISSSDTELEKTFSNAISNVQTAQQRSEQRIQSQFGRERGYLEDEAQSNFTDFAESRSGFGTQMVAFRRLVETTDKQLNDLEQRKQELILQGESEAASRIADLQVQQLQYRQQAQQNVFNNLLGLGSFFQGVESSRRQLDLEERRFGLEQQQLSLQQKQYEEGVRQFEQNFAFSLVKNAQDLKQQREDNAQREREFELSLKQFGLSERLTNAQIAKIYNDINTTPTSQGFVLPSTGNGSGDSLFVPNQDLSATEQTKVQNAIASLDLINQAEAYYASATGVEYSGVGSGIASRIKGLFRATAASFGGVTPTGESGQNWAVYGRFLDSRRAPIAKGLLGEVGNLAETEQKKAIKIFPSEFSSPREAAAAFESARRQAVANITALGTIVESGAASNPLGI